MLNVAQVSATSPGETATLVQAVGYAIAAVLVGAATSLGIALKYIMPQINSAKMASRASEKYECRMTGSQLDAIARVEVILGHLVDRSKEDAVDRREFRTAVTEMVRSTTSLTNTVDNAMKILEVYHQQAMQVLVDKQRG